MASVEAGLGALLDYGTAGAAVLDGADRRHVFVTRDYEDTHARVTGTMLGAPDAAVLPPAAVDVRARAAARARTEGRVRFEYAIGGTLIGGDMLDLTPAGRDHADAPRLGVVLRAAEQDDLQPTADIRRRLHDAERRGRIGSWVWDLASDLVVWSPELSRTLGTEHLDLLPLPFADCLACQHAHDRDLVETTLRTAAAEGGSFAFPHRIVTRDRAIRWMHCQGTAELGPDGRPVRLSGTDQDVTERHVVRQQLARLHRRGQLILESVSEGIVGLDARASVTFANNAALRMLGLPRAALQDLVLADAIRTDGDPIAATLADGRERHVERALVGAQVPVDFTVTPLLSARPEGAVVVLRDRSLRERYEHQIDRMLTALAEAQESERRRIAAEIHDDAVQTMSAIALRVEQLAETLDGDAAARLDRLRQDVRDATARLRQLLFSLQPPELVTAVGGAIEAYINSAELGLDDHVVEDRLAAQPSMATRAVLYRIAQEALRNVAKHAAARTVRVELADAPGDRVRMTIADDGVGAAPDRLREGRPGHLGVDAMRYRAQLAGGTFTLRGTPGAGTVVTVELPCTIMDEEDARP
jgi:signal transduction histidine kinase